MTHNNPHSELVVVQVQRYHETEAAILVGPPGHNVQDRLKTWLPKGLIHKTDEVTDPAHLDMVELEIPSWLMHKKELEDYECE